MCTVGERKLLGILHVILQCDSLILTISSPSDPNGSCLFAAGLPADRPTGSQNVQTFSTRQTPHLGG